jgi:NitT/TauT family transport system substrate-binding protein
MRLSKVTVALLAVTLGTLPACGSSPEATAPEANASGASTEAPASIRVGYNPIFTTSPIFVGRQRDAFADAGVDVQWTEMQTPPDMVAALSSGDLDMATLPPANLLLARSQGIPVVGLASTGTGETDPAQIAFAVRKDSGIHTIEDLRGKTVGINNYGGNLDLHLRSALEGAGLDPLTDVTITTVPLASSLQALESRQVDAASVVVTTELLIEKNFSDVLEILFSSEDIKGVDYDQEYPILVLAVNEDFLSENRDAVSAFMAGYLQAVRFIQESPEDARDMWAKDTGNEILKGLRTMPDFPNDALLSTTALEAEADLMRRYGYLDRDVDIEEVVDNSVLQELLDGE